MKLSLGNIAPNFTAETTSGTLNFYDWLGDSWGLLLSHPEDYTPVCTTELGVVANLKEEFAKRNVKAIAVSVDDIDTHLEWIKDIEDIIQGKVDFPIIADDKREIVELYGMIHRDSDENFTIRAVFIIGPDKKIRLTLTYPIAVGRNFDEILRVIDALQLNEKYQVLTPANWKQNDKVIIDPKLAADILNEKYPDGYDEIKPYLKYVKKPGK